MQRMGVPASRWARFLTVIVLAGAICVGVPTIREPILRAAGWALVINEPVVAADIVVVAVNADGAGVLEATDLAHSGIATQAGVFADPPDSVDREFVRPGLAYEDAAARCSPTPVVWRNSYRADPQGSGHGDRRAGATCLVRPTPVPFSRDGERS
jgi:hypothetical protein